LRFWISLAAALIVAFWFWFSGFSPDLLRSAETKAFIPALFDFFLGWLTTLGFVFRSAGWSFIL
jgi:hypothetical protein